MMKIISHLPPRHLDDFLAIGVAKHVFPEAEIDFLHPQDKQLEAMKENRDYVLIDIGGDYNSTYNNYDHHHNKNLPCSLVLVVENLLDKKIAKEIIEHPAVKAINLIDLLGFHKASVILKLNENESIDKKRQILLLLDLKNHNFKKHSLFDLFIKALKRSTGFDSFVSFLYELLDSSKLLEKPKEIIINQEREFLEKFKKTEIIAKYNLRVIYSFNSFAPNHSELFTRTQADLLIERNKMNPNHTSIIKNSKSPWFDKIDLSVLEEDYEKVFLHPNGFIIVLNYPIERLEPQKLIEILYEKNLKNKQEIPENPFELNSKV